MSLLRAIVQPRPTGGPAKTVLQPPDGTAAPVVDLLSAIEAAGAEAASGRARLGPLGSVLLVEAVASETTLTGLRETPGLRRSLSRLVAALGCADLGAASLLRLADRRGDRPGPLLEVGRLYKLYRELLGPRRLDDGLAFALGVGALAESPQPFADCLLPPDEIEVSGLHRLSFTDEVPTAHGLLRAVFALARSRERAVRVLLPATTGRPVLERAVAPFLEGLYRAHDLDIEEAPAPLGPEETAPGSPYAAFLRGLFQPLHAPPLLAAGELPAERLSVEALPRPDKELEHVARAVRDLVDRGVSPSQLAVVAPAPLTAPLALALEGLGVPVHLPSAPTRGSEPLPPPLRLVLSIYEALALGLPREALIQILTSRYLDFPSQARSAKALRALRTAGVRELRDLAGDSREAAGELRRRLDEALGQVLHESGVKGERRAAVAAELRDQLSAAVTELLSLPDEAPLGRHLAALARLLERLRLFELGRSAMTGAAAWTFTATASDADSLLPTPASLAAREVGARARDEEALAVLSLVLDELPRLAQALGRAGRREPTAVLELPLSRTRFQLLLKAALQRLWLPPTRGAFGLGVTVSELAAFVPRRLSHLFVVGLLEGVYPPAASDDLLVDDELRKHVNRRLDAEVLPLSQREGELMALRFAEALAHAGAAHLSYSLADEEGRPLLRSSFIDAVLAAAARPAPTLVSAPLLPSPASARTVDELWLAAAPALSPLPQTSGAAALLGGLRGLDGGRHARLRSRVGIEQSRARFFATLSRDGGAASGGPFVGKLCDERLIADLQPRLPGSRDHALSASALEDYAKCPFRFFVRRVLKAAPLTEGGDDLDPLASGRLHHSVLEEFFRDRRDRGRLPLRADADDRAALEQAIATALAGFEENERIGHRALFQVRLARLRDSLWRLVEREAQAGIEPGCLPARFEHRFGPLVIGGQSQSDGRNGGDAEGLHIEGIIDRVDVGPGRVLVLDYKIGRLFRYEQQLKHELLQTSFQLPLYAAAVQVDPELGGPTARVTARYYSLRQGLPTRSVLDDAELISLDPVVRARAPERNVAEVAYQLWRRLREGDFRVAPRTCEGCGLERVCRISAEPLLTEAAADEGDAASAETPPSTATPTPLYTRDTEGRR